jgi:macrolide transport system ATP-binding/permease protein
MLELLSSLNRAGRTIVLITHERDVAARASRVVEILDGRVSPASELDPAGAAR